jgi:hypothetical protein
LASASDDLLALARGRKFKTILADPPWRFRNGAGKAAPSRRPLSRYGAMTLDAIEKPPAPPVAADTAYLYLWAPNAPLRFTLSSPCESGI